MALGRKCKSCLKTKRGGGTVAAEAEGEGIVELGFVKYTRALGRKRIGISNNGEEASPADLYPKTPLKKQRSGNMIWESETAASSALEALPQEILIKVVCGVDHDDLKRLFRVSKAIREATLVAKQWHFAYCTPSKTPAFRTAIDLSDSNSSLDEIEAPNAPKQWRQMHRKLPNQKKLAELSVNLFASWDDEAEEDQGTRKGLFMEEDE
ncbi:F-box protein SKIP27-like [Pyrus ussuriensis x Pyrus communis]|uniref:F-box protein SKIP27-like n=1 Tax=Pyrus ussuriensis x Pyrus communis TaxID=2448454 RepID=A0A5N5FS88_9ROSA|nr:F-box protein SKIP27-like [Pyrus ussuriensis x Pyrus communis]